MPDFSVALPAQVQVDPMKSLSSMLGVANASQAYQAGNIAIQGNQAVLDERNALRNLAKDPRVLDADGNVDHEKFGIYAPQVAPTLGAPISKAITEASTAQTNNAASRYQLTAAQGGKLMEMATGLMNDPAVVSGSDPHAIIEKLLDVKQRAIGLGVPKTLVEMQMAPLISMASSNPKGLQQHLANVTQGGTPAATQSAQVQPLVTQVSTDQGTQFVQANPRAVGGPGNIGTPYTPPNGIATSPTGQMGVTNPATGTFKPVQNTSPNQPPVNFPTGESADTWKELQGQRTAAQMAANGAPVMHDINRTIVTEANKGFNTGSLGALTQKMASATGYTIGDKEATDYNLLGKMLERSALTAAQSMGPHTNAGLEAAVRANGSLEYTPAAIKKIANLNDALVSGSELYSKGLEKAISSSPDNVFTKRKFDESWRAVATPQVLRFKNAVDNNNPEEVNAIIKEVGGKASKGAKALHMQLQGLLNLSGQ